MTVGTAASERLAHPRGVWLEPSTGREIAQGALLREVANRQAVLLGETHTVYEIHRWQLQVATVLHALRPNIAMGLRCFRGPSKACSTTGLRANSRRTHFCRPSTGPRSGATTRTCIFRYCTSAASNG